MPPHLEDGGPPEPGEVTRLLGALSAGKDGAADRVIEMVYAELRSLADGGLRGERADPTLQPTALVHEAWMKLAGQPDVAWQNRSHFLGIASLAMRRVLVDHAHMRKRDKRGGGARREELVTGIVGAAGPLGQDLAINKGVTTPCLDQGRIRNASASLRPVEFCAPWFGSRNQNCVYTSDPLTRLASAPL